MSPAATEKGCVESGRGLRQKEFLLYGLELTDFNTIVHAAALRSGFLDTIANLRVHKVKRNGA